MRTGLIQFAKALAAVLVSAAPLGAQRHIVQTYTVSDGLPSDHVLCLATDHDGFLWICTRNGLARFDGSRFVTYGTEDGLPDPVVNNFLHARSGGALGGDQRRCDREARGGRAGPEDRAVRLYPVSRDAWFGPRRVVWQAHVYTVVGRHDEAVDRLRYLLSIPADLITVLQLRMDPRWDPLRDHPGFQALAEEQERQPWA